MRRPPALLLVAVLVAACRQPEPVTSPTPLPVLAEPATVEPVAPTAPPSPPSATTTPAPPMAGREPATEPAAVTEAATRAPTGADAPTAPGEPTAPAASPFRTLVRIDDRSGDAGVEGPPYADLAGVLLEDDGERLRVTVSLAAAPPAMLADGEVIGVGVDVHLDPSGESDYQLFVDGGSDGWRAYLQTPEGFVAYPGGFSLRGADLVLTVPWTSLGSPSRGEVGAFLDWSQRRLLLNAAAQDRAPDSGRSTFAR